MCNQPDRTKDEREAKKRKARCVAWSAVGDEEGSRRGSGGMLWLCADYVGTMGERKLRWIAVVGLEGSVKLLVWYCER